MNLNEDIRETVLEQVLEQYRRADMMHGFYVANVAEQLAGDRGAEATGFLCDWLENQAGELEYIGVKEKNWFRKIQGDTTGKHQRKVWAQFVEAGMHGGESIDPRLFPWVDWDGAVFAKVDDILADIGG